ncbi:MAG: flagellar protein FlaG [Tistlia sp.]|uniref:flagellar protein FlaG n=1 Tax=Tistlia sp. TaxID=3057121 RepID=UPI0034A3A30A
MEHLSILPPTSTAAASGASLLPHGQAAPAQRPAPDGGFAVKSLESLSGAEGPPRDEVALTSVKIELDVDEPTRRVVAVVRDRETGEVLNQFPAEAILRDARGIRELLARELDMKV